MEESPLLVKKQLTIIKQQFCNSRRCIRSKAALLILLWSFIASLTLSFIFYSNLSLSQYDYSFPLIHGCVSLIFLFYPLAGHLADIKFGHHKTVINSVHLICYGMVAVIVGISILTIIWSTFCRKLSFVYHSTWFNCCMCRNFANPPRQYWIQCYCSTIRAGSTLWFTFRWPECVHTLVFMVHQGIYSDSSRNTECNEHAATSNINFNSIRAYCCNFSASCGDYVYC